MALPYAPKRPLNQNASRDVLRRISYLSSLVDGITDELKYALVAGAVTGGGLTVIANASNSAGVGISPLGLFLGAWFPTVEAIAFFWLLF